ncbi:MAG: hypothetical protein JWR61_5734 [Ferruginibacter sp.]|nr:hypothetical protein [Ferruginibacter sp.]
MLTIDENSSIKKLAYIDPNKQLFSLGFFRVYVVH